MKRAHLTLLYILFMLPLIPSLAQETAKDYLPMDYARNMHFVPGDNITGAYYISSMPVTNKQYILYMVWSNAVYGANYPEVVKSLLPGYGKNTESMQCPNPFNDSLSFADYLKSSPPFVSEYIFNPTYLNAPVIGISYDQAVTYCRWLTDRYNEYSMIKDKYMMADLNQMNDNTFNTESLIFQQYTGVWDKMGIAEFFISPEKKGFDFSNYVIRPAFHPATKNELKTAIKSGYIESCYCTQKKDHVFLKLFYDSYLPEEKGYIYTSPIFEGDPYYLVSGFSTKTLEFPEKISEWVLDSYTEGDDLKLENILEKNGYTRTDFINPLTDQAFDKLPRKDSLGRMPLIITGENKDKCFEVFSLPLRRKPEIITGTEMIFDHKSQQMIEYKGNIYTTFRFAVKAIRKPDRK